MNEGESDPDTPATVYAGTRGGGVFRIDQLELNHRVYLPLIMHGQ